MGFNLDESAEIYPSNTLAMKLVMSNVSWMYRFFPYNFFLINKNMNDHVIVIVEGLYKVELGIIRFRWNRFSFLRFGFIDGRPPFEQTPRRIPYSHANSCIPRFFSETNSPGLHQSENDHLQRKSKKVSFLF